MSMVLMVLSRCSTIYQTPRGPGKDGQSFSGETYLTLFKFGTPATEAASRPSTATFAPGPPNRYRRPVIGPWTVSPVSPVYSNSTVITWATRSGPAATLAGSD